MLEPWFHPPREFFFKKVEREQAENYPACLKIKDPTVQFFSLSFFIFCPLTLGPFDLVKYDFQEAAGHQLSAVALIAGTLGKNEQD